MYLEPFCTYILYSLQHQRFYIGQCRNLASRISRHNGGHGKSTKAYRPWQLIGFIEKTTRSDAIILERKLKNLNTEDLKKFILKYFNKSY